MGKVIKEESIRDKSFSDDFAAMRNRDIKTLLRRAQFIEIGCPACGSLKFNHTFQKGGFAFVTCACCKTVFVNPRPSEKDLKWYYAESEMSKAFAKMVDVKKETRKELIYTKRAEFVISAVEKYIPGQKDCSITEIGSGTGGFLETLREMKPGWRYIAIEPGRTSVSLLKEKGFKVIEDIIEEVDSSSIPTANVILNFELIEHIFDTRKFASTVHNAIKPGGLFILTTPNYNGFDFLAIGKEYKNIAAPNHLNYFNTKSIKTLLEMSGFDVLEIMTPGLLDVNLVRDYYGPTKNTGNRFMDFLLYEADNNTLSGFQNFLQEHRLSGHMFITAQRPLIKARKK